MAIYKRNRKINQLQHGRAVDIPVFNPFHVTSLFLYPSPRKTLKNSGFLRFSEGLEQDHWQKIS